MDGGIEKVEDADAQRAARRQARVVVVKALVLAAVLDALVYALP